MKMMTTILSSLLISSTVFASDLNVACTALNENLQGQFNLTRIDSKLGSTRTLTAELINFRQGGIKMTTEENVSILLLENVGQGENSNCRLRSFAFLENAQIESTDGADNFTFADPSTGITLIFKRK